MKIFVIVGAIVIALFVALLVKTFSENSYLNDINSKLKFQLEDIKRESQNKENAIKEKVKEVEFWKKESLKFKREVRNVSEELKSRKLKFEKEFVVESKKEVEKLSTGKKYFEISEEKAKELIESFAGAKGMEKNDFEFCKEYFKRAIKSENEDDKYIGLFGFRETLSEKEDLDFLIQIIQSTTDEVFQFSILRLLGERPIRVNAKYVNDFAAEVIFDSKLPYYVRSKAIQLLGELQYVEDSNIEKLYKLASDRNENMDLRCDAMEVLLGAWRFDPEKIKLIDALYDEISRQ